MEASAAGIVCSLWWSSIVYINRMVWSHTSCVDIYHVSFSKMVILTKFKHASAVCALCSASTCSVEYILQPVVTGTRHWLVDSSIHLDSFIIFRSPLRWPSDRLNGYALDRGLHGCAFDRCLQLKLGRLLGRPLGRFHWCALSIGGFSRM